MRVEEVVIGGGDGIGLGTLVSPRPVDQRLEDGADTDALLGSNGFDPCAPLVVEAQAQDG